MLKGFKQSYDTKDILNVQTKEQNSKELYKPNVRKIIPARMKNGRPLPPTE